MNKLLVPFCFMALLACNPKGGSQSRETLQHFTIDIWIKDVNLIDGLGSAPFPADVLIAGDSIRFIGDIGKHSVEAKEIIEGAGKILSPGFIDMHAHGDPLKTPGFENFLSMGVTTIVLGQDGFHPFSPSFEKWRQTVQGNGTGVNLVLFAGHNTLREESGIGFNTHPTQAEMAVMEKMLEELLESGCFGLSTGLEYTPGMYATTGELEALAKVVGKYDRLISSHMRNEDDDQLAQSIQELLTQGKHCRVHISHFKSVYGNGKERATQLLGILGNARREGIQISADIYPYTASYTTIGIVFPKWARPPHNFDNVKKHRRPELAEFLRNKITQRNGPSAILFGTGPYKGKNLEEVAHLLGKDFEEVLIDDIGPTGTSAAYFIMDAELQETLLSDTYAMVSSDGSPTMRHPRGHGTFAKVIQEYAGEGKLFSLPIAIHKMTGLPAKTLGLHNRGTIAVGQKADVLVFDPQKIRAPANYENPFQVAEGFDWVVVNGEIVKSPEAGIRKERVGKVLSYGD